MTTIEKSVDERVESLCRWGAVRAGVIAAAPIVGSLTLLANDLYMVARIGRAHGATLSGNAIKTFIVGLGGAFARRTLIALIPFAPLQIPFAAGVTYGIGKAASAWIGDGMPDKVDQYREYAQKAKEYAESHLDDFRSDSAGADPEPENP